MNTIYDVDYFIRKFEAIPERLIGTSQPTGCAFGQCKTTIWSDGSQTEEGKALESLLIKIPNLVAAEWSRWDAYDGTPARINNGDICQYQQPTPKQRILAALYDIKKLSEPTSRPYSESVSKELAELALKQNSEVDVIKIKEPGVAAN